MDSHAAALVTSDSYPEVEGHTDWLAVATRIASLYEPPHTGRPSNALTDVYRVNKLLRKLADGNYTETATLAAGFSKQTLYNWRDQAKAGNVAAIALLDAMEKASAEAEADAVDDIRKAGKAGPQFWAASATRLERRHPDRWGKRQEDSAAPKVVVQIGIKGSDVTFAPQISAVTQDLHKLSE